MFGRATKMAKPRISFSFSTISTPTVDNFVDKPVCLPCKARIQTLSNKMPNLKAKNKSFKISVLQTLHFYRTAADAAYSYKVLQQGISHQ
jgi:hypothetical protein